jgi:hypothetical protein
MRNRIFGLMRNKLLNIYRCIAGILVASAALMIHAGDPVFLEKIFMHLDRNYFLAGEDIRYALYCRELSGGLSSGASKVAHVELISSDGEVITQQKVLLEEGMGQGCLPIPEDIESQETVLRAYTSWMRNFKPETWFHTRALVIHPEIRYTAPDKDSTFQTQPLVAKTPETSKAASPLSVTQSQSGYAIGESVDLKLNLSPGFPAARISLSVVPAGTSLSVFGGIEASGPSESPETDQPGGQTAAPGVLFLPDLEGLQLSGQVRERLTGTPVEGTTLILSRIDSLAELRTSKSDKRGRFRFDLNGLLGKKDFIIQTSLPDQDVLISLDQEFSLKPLPDHLQPVKWQDDLDTLFAMLLLRQQIQQAYTDVDPGQPDAPSTFPGPHPYPFYGPYDHLVLMDEFIKLPVMEEVFRELGKRVFLEREKGNLQVRLLDLNANRIIGDDPCFLIDGVPFFDSGKLLDLDPAGIERIALLSQKYFIEDLVMDGIIDIRTRERDAGMMEFPRSAIRQYYQGFPLNSSSVRVLPEVEDTRIPRAAATHLFEPLLELSEERSTMVTFPAPELPGDYQIIIRGFSGRDPVEMMLSFSVKD